MTRYGSSSQHVIGDIKWKEFKDSVLPPLTRAQAEEETKNQRMIYGSSISQTTPEGDTKLLVNGEWRVVH